MMSFSNRFNKFLKRNGSDLQRFIRNIHGESFAVGKSKHFLETYRRLRVRGELYSFISSSFNWGSAIEGHHYWNDLDRKWRHYWMSLSPETRQQYETINDKEARKILLRKKLVTDQKFKKGLL